VILRIPRQLLPFVSIFDVGAKEDLQQWHGARKRTSTQERGPCSSESSESSLVIHGGIKEPAIPAETAHLSQSTITSRVHKAPDHLIAYHLLTHHKYKPYQRTYHHPPTQSRPCVPTRTTTAATTPPTVWLSKVVV
jgi:hypothetical protein